MKPVLVGDTLSPLPSLGKEVVMLDQPCGKELRALPDNS